MKEQKKSKAAIDKDRKEREKLDEMAKETADMIYKARMVRAWRTAGTKPFDCDRVEIWEYKAGILPGKCNECWKVCLFKFYDADFMREFLETLDQSTFFCKYNSGVAVFYFDTKEEAEQFLAGIRKTLDDNEWTGEIQRACKEYQDFRPEWWLDKVTFSPPIIDTYAKCKKCGWVHFVDPFHPDTSWRCAKCPAKGKEAFDLFKKSEITEQDCPRGCTIQPVNR